MRAVSDDSREAREERTRRGSWTTCGAHQVVGKIKILIGIGREDSIFSYNAAQFVARRPWRPGTQIRLVSAVEQSDLIQEYVEEEKANAYQQAGAAIERAAAILRGSPNEFEITTEIFARRLIRHRGLPPSPPDARRCPV